jgi:hypothetical protein
MLAKPDKASTEHLDFKKFGESIRGLYGTDVSDEFLEAAKTGDPIAIHEDRTVEVG